MKEGIKTNNNPQLQFTGKTIDVETVAKITGLINSIMDKRLNKKWKRIGVMVHEPVENQIPVEQVHKIWNTDYVASIKSPDGLPCLPAGTLCPPGSRLIEVSYISRLSGGMGSYHQFYGYFVSAVLSPGDNMIVDARIEEAY